MQNNKKGGLIIMLLFAFFNYFVIGKNKFNIFRNYINRKINKIMINNVNKM